MTLHASPQTLTNLAWPEIRVALAKRTSNAVGSELATELPFLSRDEALVSMQRVAEARTLLRRELPIPVGGVASVRDSLAHARKGVVLDAHQLDQCVTVLEASAQVRRFVTGLSADVPLLAGMVSPLHEHAEIVRRVRATFEPSGTMRDDASADLAQHRRRARALHKNIKVRIDTLLAEREFSEQLQESYYSVRNDRYVVPLKAEFRSHVPGIVHNASHSGQTLFVEPQVLVPMGNDLAIAASLAEEAEQRVLAELSDGIADIAQELLENEQLLGAVDLVQASARLADDLQCGMPELVEPDGVMELLQARHPLLLLQGKSVVPNTIRLESTERALVISGPNAGGKTVALSTVGLCMVMARAGLHIPAEQGSRVPWLSGLSCAIGDAQDLSQDLSTFSGHLAMLASLLSTSESGWLCLIDEIATGTDPAEGAALATAVLERLVALGTRVMVTTHLEQVKAFGVHDSRFVNARVGFESQSLRPSFRLQLGVAGVSNAIDVAVVVGMPVEVVQRARQVMRDGGALTLALSRLEEQSREAEELNRELRLRATALQAEQEAVLKKDQALDKARGQIAVDVRRALKQELEEARATASARVAQLQQSQSMQAAQQARTEIDALVTAVDSKIAVDEARLHDSAVPQEQGTIEVLVGMRVHVPALGKEGEVLSLHGKQAVVAVGALRTRARIADLVPWTSGSAASNNAPGKGVAPSENRKTRAPDTGSRTRPSGDGPSGRCDVRGLRVDDALRELEATLDACYYKGPSVVVVVHGHGTGALRDAIRDTLGTSPYVESFRPGERHEGGDGSTWVQLSR